MWDYRGYRGPGDPALLATKEGKAAIVIGTAGCVWEDLARVEHLREAADIFAVKEIGAFLPWIVHHWVTLHPKELPHLMALRLVRHYGMDIKPVTHSNKPHSAVDHAWEMANYGANSGFYAAEVALVMGYDRIILAGCPADNTPHFYDPPWRKTTAGDSHVLKAWRLEIMRNGEIRSRVRSLSGWTRDLLGAPE